MLINSNPATIMTDPEMADRTYVEPITPEAVEKSSPKNIRTRFAHFGWPDGAQYRGGCGRKRVLGKYNVEMIGASLDVIYIAKTAKNFARPWKRSACAFKSGFARSLDEVLDISFPEIGFPIIVRPSFTLGGTGGGVAYNREELMQIVSQGGARRQHDYWPCSANQCWAGKNMNWK